jgi:hypothetical protein
MTGLEELINNISKLVNLAIPLVASLALLAFFWGLFKFIAKADDSASHEEGRNLMIWGIVALFVMVAVWGLVNFIATNLGIGTGGIIQIETLPTNP